MAQRAGTSGKLPEALPNIKPCKWDDSTCLKASAQAAIPVIAAGIPELGVASSDPMVVEKMSSNNAGLNLDLSQITITGLSQCQVGKVSRDLEKSTIVLSMRCPIELDSHYNVSGSLVIIPIEGSGEFGIKAENVKLKFEAKIEEETGADGKRHWKVASYKHSYEPDKVVIRITNLFGGDEKTAAPVLEFINQQWRVFIQSVGKAFVDEFVKLMVDNVNKWMAAVPTEELEVV
ncbi:circadian clock-controlled protein daywake-like [Cydia splendana]|uniref:circadian clock-controlled protein daywake-like n=1 Tax=Cydia splendana TaxID=1100963 RepID=UPI00300DB78F